MALNPDVVNVLDEPLARTAALDRACAPAQAAECVPALLAALTAKPHEASHWLALLEALLLTGRTEEAAEVLTLAQQHGLCGASAEDFAARLNVKLLSFVHELETQLLAQVENRNFASARSSARVLTTRFPGRGLGWKVAGVLLAAEGKIDDALSAMQHAVRLLPEDAEAHCNLGATLSKAARFAEAEVWLQKALAMAPGLVDACVHLGFVYASLGKYPQAETMYRHAVPACKLSDNPQKDMRCHSSLLFLLSHDPTLPATDLFAEHLAIGHWLEASLRPAHPQFFNGREPERRLKVGFVSGDFRDHALANFFEPILQKLHAHGRLELYGFYNYDGEDDTTRRMRTCFAHWHSIINLSDAELLELIKADRIDILIDLASHTSFNRLSAFAHKAAPVQVSWLGYPGTTGLRVMDYYLADPHFLPAGQFDASFTEKIVHLPAAWTFAPHAESPPVNRLPALEAGFMTFGSFNRLGKINPFTVRLWSRLLDATSNSILVMAGIPGAAQCESLTELFEAQGIARERLAFFPRSSMQTYLALHNLVDMCLDTFPYTGGTTTNHALWMGVPTLTLIGQTPASRQCAANLGHLGLEGFTAADPDDFVHKGRYWSTQVAALAEVRHGLRERWLKSAIRRPEVLTSALESALRHMWRRWCEGLPPQAFCVIDAKQGKQ